MGKTLKELRAACKPFGIKVRKSSVMDRPYISFFIEGIPVSEATVIPSEFYQANREAFEALREIRERFYGMEIDGQRAIGLKP